MQEYKLQVRVEKSKLICSILGDIQGCEFAFYLKVNNVRIAARWYEPNNTCVFLVPTETYKIIGFIKKENGERLDLHSDFYEGIARSEIRDLQYYSVSIFGSCVSRDLLEFQKEYNFRLKKYFARCSVVSAVSQPIKVEEEKITLESNFQKRQVIADLDKRMWSELKEDKSDYLIVDFIDERFAIGKIGESYFTLSNEMVQSGYMKDYEIIEREKKSGLQVHFLQKETKEVYYVDNKSLEMWLDLFWDRVLQIYSTENIILHEAKLADYFYDTDGTLQKFDKNYLQNNKKFNELLEYMYTYSKNKLKNCIYISVGTERHACCKHKWGLAPMHYTDEYYNQVIDNIMDSVTSQKNVSGMVD